MNKRKKYIVGYIVLLILFVGLMCVGISRCSKGNSHLQGDGSTYEKNEDIQKDELREKEDDQGKKENQLESKRTPEQEYEKGEFDDWLNQNVTGNTNTNVFAQESKDSGSDNSEKDDNDDETKEDNKMEESNREENKEDSLSASDTDEHSNKKWSPFY